ncbi:MAG: hypothetical protein A3H50_02600 [Candidatus Levybacteria bacterium RIFCSPLOWO2_02_FULL_37_10]|nr:MAG: hypothetical protein A2860_01620 [Candidatus Levybacteria bacterium RIFCSPHIGHO2_01_FULL_37_33]OGH17315.1 MAG: hypothetical protein A3C97_01795 [Candidatus Levybacteria bacterium RIFCSPHIGHO2_02_FULL_37_11]OGH29139.1 MAG: hypothetical protein A3F30_00995 [Candidatus Levybacteria bacterium RIFCSPHIGHO2_12_FULL_37_12]OGH33063.1 MAG: hypothetical protein A2953_00585 [Candidatus Levybacteria bacterium RIFCSPLOWO2_01_FULL_36_54]OGH43220.1 MAG: hypothetical protein A3H50_02600 [Candidatus Lev
MQKILSHSKLFRKPILNMRPYVAPIERRTGRDYLLLDFNERTIPPHPLVLEEISKYINKGNLQLYPEYGDLNEVIADYVGVGPQEVIPTVGGDQAIDIVTRALAKDGDTVIIPRPTFAMLEQAARIQGASIVSPRYRGSNLEFPFDEVMQDIKPEVKLVVICNPNNPTGTPVPKEQIKLIIERASEVNSGVLVDEAYHEFAPELTAIDLLANYSNLFVIRSFAKTLGVPSLRAGLVASQKQNIEELKKIRGPYDVNMPASAAMKALRHQTVRDDIKKYVDEVMKVSKPMLEDFYRKNGIKFFPSSAGFHLLEEPGLYDFLRQKEGQRILIRPRSDPPGTVRVSLGTREDTEKYIEALQEYLQANK